MSSRRLPTSSTRPGVWPHTDVSEGERGPVSEAPAPGAESRVWAYLGVGCLTAIIGLVGGGMIAVLVAKIVGAVQGCLPDKESGAPCNWDRYWTWGARIGLVTLPVMAIWRMRRKRSTKHTQ